MFPLTHGRGSHEVLFFGYARTALEYGCRILGLREGDEILYPDLICDVLMVPANKLGLQVRFYPVDDRLKPDLDTARKLLTSRTRVFLAVNYFGFPQPFAEIKEFCRDANLIFIEDNAHGFLSQDGGAPLGTFGDMAIFSFRKTIPLLNGACLVVNQGNYKNRIQETTREAADLPMERNPIRGWKSSARRLARRWDLPLEKLYFKPASLPAPGSSESQDWHYGISPETLMVLREFDFDKERQVRRNRFLHWQMILGGRNEVDPVFPHLEGGVVPLGYPCYVDDREAWLRWGKANRTPVSSWPTLPQWAAKHLPQTLNRAKRLIVFPC